uniref:nucleolar protein 8 isoform X2 n=1 Tax=Jaculus jaculus TaxID=51337 RepID=UPI001E1B35C8|nr:nucleolar protein 8 isoform X2 [Jaculus jaculus]
MKANRETKRLFVGGLGEAISKTDLQNQFSRFGDVSDVEIITRKDEQGNAQKVFAYINISIAEADLKKCMSMLNKTKWKGGTLQIQLAKESFLHRLAQEREEAKARRGKADTTLSEKAGGAPFHMRAVPGTEVPGHKNWVVSKFGRVLPVLHLKNQHKRKIMKYDPSKYCHNLKEIGEDFPNTVPIASLTWELEGGNDPMSKKRRGEFSDFHGPPKKIIKVQKGVDSAESKGSNPNSRTSSVMKNNTLTQQQAAQKTACDSVTPKSLIPHSISQKLKNLLFQTSGFESVWKRNSMSDDDLDSEDELRMMISEEENLQRTGHSSVNESENDPFEVVRDNFKSDIHKHHTLTQLGTSNISSYVSNNIGNDSEYDSGDTDEIIAMKKHFGNVKNCAELSQTEKSINKKTSLKKKELSNNCAKVQKTKTNTESVLSRGVKSPSRQSPSDSSTSDGEESEGDEEYKAMVKNCPRVTLTLADLEQLACSDQEMPGKDTEIDGLQTPEPCELDRTSKTPKTPRGRKCICPEEIVASLLEEENGYENSKSKENNLKPKFQAFKGLGCLYGKESVEEPLKETVAFNNINGHQSSLTHARPSSISVENGSPCADGSSKLTSCQPAKKVNSPDHLQRHKKQDCKLESSSCSAKGSKDSALCLLPLKSKKSLSISAETPRIDFDKDTTIRDTSEEEKTDSSSPTPAEIPPKVCPRKDVQKSTDDFSPSIRNASDVNAKDKHAKDNQKRLAALEARQKAREMRKKLVHEALANLDGHPEDKPTHIVFASDGESDSEDTSTQEQSCPGEELVKESMAKTSGKLFDSSEDEESGSEDDDDRFKIKPQFEGRAGQKLMNLQSQFGSDERFRMDSRFLESDSEEEQEEVNEDTNAEEDELAAERKKTLNVAQSVLNINLNNATSKGSAPAKKFKDVIRYDPTRQDHATYERRKDDKPKESKAKRKKIKEEAEKLPEVSKEMYYNIAADLKEIFQTTKDPSEKEEGTAWNEDCAGEEIHNAAALTSEAEQASGFTFSFFDSDTKDVKEDTYRVEAVKPVKIVCQGGARLQDSSSEEDDVTEEAEYTKPSPGEEAFPEKETTRFFFFSKNDERLNGSGLFWSGVANNISKTSWEVRTNNLLMDCRKKHKEAKRKMKPK